MPKNFKVGALVWAKMKGYPPWPGEIMEPPSMKSSKSKKPQHYVLFFGSNNHAWIPDENILEHNQKLIEEYGTKRKIPTFQKAVETIIEKNKNASNEMLQSESEGAASPKFKDPESSYENHSLEMSMESPDSSTEVKKKFSGKKAKKRSYSPNPSEPESVSLTEKAARYEDVYRDLLNNIPPNVEVDIHAIHSSAPTGGFLARTYVERPETPPLDLLEGISDLEDKETKPGTRKVGFLGLGKFGQGIVKNLRKCGHSVILWNRSPEKCKPFVEKLNVEVASTPADVVIAADITFCCVSDEKAAKMLVFGNCGVISGLQNCAGMKKGYVEMTSMDANTSQEIADKIKLIGGRYLEAPLKGTRIDANNGTLYIQTAGDQSLYDDCRSCFSAISKSHKYLGAEVGYASKIHLVHSMFMGTVYCTLAESIALAMRAKVESKDLLEVFTNGILQNNKLLDKGKAMVDHNYVNETTLKHVQKDLNLGLLLGSSVEQPTPVCAAANEVYKHCKVLNYADHDVSAIYEGTKP